MTPEEIFREYVRLQARDAFQVWSAEDIDAIGDLAERLFDALPRPFEFDGIWTARERMRRALRVMIPIVGLAAARRYELDWMYEALWELYGALGEVERGLKPPVFQPGPHSAKAARESDYDLLVKSISAIAWKKIVEFGVGSDDAAQQVADCLTKHEFLKNKLRDNEPIGSASTKSIKNWAKRLDGREGTRALDAPRIGYLPSSPDPAVYFGGASTPEQVLSLLVENLEALRRSYFKGLSMVMGN